MEYEEYCNMLTEQLWALKDKYKKKPSALRILEAYKITRELKVTIPEWILAGLDKIADPLYQKELRERTHRTDRIKFIEYVVMRSSKDPAAAKKAYATKHCISLSAVEKRLKTAKKKYIK